MVSTFAINSNRTATVRERLRLSAEVMTQPPPNAPWALPHGRGTVDWKRPGLGLFPAYDNPQLPRVGEVRRSNQRSALIPVSSQLLRSLRLIPQLVLHVPGK